MSEITSITVVVPVTNLTDEIDTLRAQLAAAKVDAERYRWLRDTGDATWRPFALREGYSAEEADAAIDSALRGEVKP